jgi:hypothetical protein
MAGRKADRARILGDVREAQRLPLADQHAEDPTAAREVADRRARLLVDADGDELLEPSSRRIDDAERSVARPGQLRSRLDQLLEERLERQLGAECDTGLDEDAEPVGRGDRGLSRMRQTTPKVRGGS